MLYDVVYYDTQTGKPSSEARDVAMSEVDPPEGTTAICQSKHGYKKYLKRSSRLDGVRVEETDGWVYRPTPRVIEATPLGTTLRIGDEFPIRARDDLDSGDPPLEYADGRLAWSGSGTREARDEHQRKRDVVDRYIRRRAVRLEALDMDGFPIESLVGVFDLVQERCGHCGDEGPHECVITHYDRRGVYHGAKLEYGCRNCERWGFGKVDRLPHTSPLKSSGPDRTLTALREYLVTRVA